MNCAKCLELISQSLEGALPPREAAEMKGHLAACSGCRTEMALQRRITEALAATGEPGLAADFAERVSKQAFARRRLERPAPRWDYAMPVAAVASLLVLAIIHRGDIAAVVAPPLAAAGRTAVEAAGRIGALSGGAASAAGSAGRPAAGLLELWGPIACAAAIMLWASARVYAVIRR
jgi:anti-sigma factor RsiW